MFDVLPPTPRATPRPRHPKRQNQVGPAAPRSSNSPQPGPRVITLNWRLPARLRRPIRHELARARQQKKHDQAIVRFERRPLYSQLPTAHPTYSSPPATPVASPGVEQHTADVYKNSRPNIALSVPPYRGQISRQYSRPHPSRVADVAGPPRPAPVAPQPAVRAPRPYRSQDITSLSADVRDVPYSWKHVEQQPPARKTISLTEAENVLRPIKKPKRRLALPLHLSVFPWRRKEVPTLAGKKKI